ncbi:MAG: carbamoyltransferase [Candidatus Marinimicrobia bacterium]|nr:carbamoyltransferase [Candidatus Neomarinimicrobiota bacterium]
MHILGISAFYHDSAACLITDGEIVAAAQEERFTRIKHDPSYPANAIAYCLKEGGLEADQLDHVAFYDKPWLKFERILDTHIAFAPRGLASFIKAIPPWVKYKLWMDSRIKALLTGYGGEIYYPEHHQSHAASAFFPSPFKDAAILTMDGVGEWATTSWGVGEGHHIDLQYEIHFPHSLGLLYSAFTYHCGFKVNSGEYKLMGLAPYGEPRYVQTIREHLIDVRDDGSFRLDMRYFNYGVGSTMTNGKFDGLFGGPPRQPESEITKREMDMAASIQAVTEEVILKCARHIRRVTGQRNLALAGGVALNCVANGKLVSEGVFDDIWIQPAAGDAGGALGCALFVWHQILGNDRHVLDTQKGSYLGPQWTRNEVMAWLDEQGHPYHDYGEQEALAKVADELAGQKIVGLFDGRMEFGPRALGSRSILGDARDPGMQSRMNQRIKYRESFRPFAPSCLLEDVGEYFQLDRPSPYMLIVADVKTERRLKPALEERDAPGSAPAMIPRSDIPAVTHIDYSARVQTVDGQYNKNFYQLLSAFKAKTGYSVVANTSFNVRGEPIVCSPAEAYQCFMRTDMDVLMMEGLILYKGEQPEFEDKLDWRSQYELD